MTSRSHDDSKRWPWRTGIMAGFFFRFSPTLSQQTSAHFLPNNFIHRKQKRFEMKLSTDKMSSVIMCQIFIPLKRLLLIKFMSGKMNSTSLFFFPPVYSKPQLTSVFPPEHTRHVRHMHSFWCANHVCMFYVEYKHTNIFIYTYT